MSRLPLASDAEVLFEHNTGTTSMVDGLVSSTNFGREGARRDLAQAKRGVSSFRWLEKLFLSK